MAGTGALIITSVASGGFALTGIALSGWMSARRDERQVAAATALDLANVEKLVWVIGGYTDLNIALQQQEARLAFAGVPEDLTKAFHHVTLACWQDFQEAKGVDDDGEDFHAINTQFLDARRGLSRAVAAYLLGRKLRSRKQRKEALVAAEEALEAFRAEYPNFRFR